jgi:hypothetical protein
MAITLFGDAHDLLTDGRRPMSLVPGIKTGGGTEFAGDALAMACGCLEMTNQRRPRFIYCISDGGWYDTEDGVAEIHALRAIGVPTVHISIGAEPLSVDADRIVVISDPADAMTVIANDTIDALAARRTSHTTHN